MGTLGLTSPAELVAPGALEVHTRLVGGHWQVTLRGELVLETVDQVAREIDRVAPQEVDLDLSGVTFIDSLGLTFLVRRADRLVLTTVSGSVDRLIRLCGLQTELRYR